jgi:hypothetical protein
LVLCRAAIWRKALEVFGQRCSCKILYATSASTPVPCRCVKFPVRVFGAASDSAPFLNLPDSRNRLQYGGLRRADAYDHCAQRRWTTHPTVDIAPAYVATGTDQSQGKGQVISNINACLAVQSTIKSTLGPYGGDLLMVDANGKQTITNDGATVMKVGSTSKLPGRQH